METEWSEAQAAHLLRRAGFGATAGEIRSATLKGREATVESLLQVDEDMDIFPPQESFADGERYLQIIQALAEARSNPAMAEQVRREMNRAEARAILDLRAWWLQRMRYSPNPLREKMTLFWHGHFATSFSKVKNAHFLWGQNELFRMHALGPFLPLARGVALDPAMMRYLDVAGSSKGKPNENFARELMELFLLGEGNYSEEDIREAARAFTGYSIDPRNLQIAYRARRADTGTKTLFGHSGVFSAKDVVNIIASQPECAPFLARKIAVFFVCENPPDSLVAKMATAFRDSGMNTASLLKTMFLAPEFYAEDVIGTQIKSPVEWLVGTSRSLSVPEQSRIRGQQALRDLGQSLFEPPNVRGWEGGRQWISASTLLLRNNLAGQIFLESGKLDNALKDVPLEDPNLAAGRLEFLLLARKLPVSQHRQLVEILGADGLPVGEAALRSAVLHILQLPEYQLT